MVGDTRIVLSSPQVACLFVFVPESGFNAKFIDRLDRAADVAAKNLAQVEVALMKSSVITEVQNVATGV